MANKHILEFVQSSENIIDEDSNDENKMSNAALFPTPSEIRNIMKKSKTPCNNALKPVEQVLIALRFYAVACMQLAIADLFDVSQPTVCRVVHRVSEAIASLLPDFIHLPVNRRVQNGVKEILQYRWISKSYWSFGWHLCTYRVSGGEDAERFRCRKNYFALNVQTIVDSDLVIRNVVARWPGSAHDSTVFNNSAACLSLKTNALYQDFHLLGDTGYACEKYLLTPFWESKISI
ncbi:nuclease HARBI1 [Trichonephila clavipes]|nr:nuclease HARBI1 [Trichonephila clavipes]